MAFNIPLPPGLAGASPQTLGGAAGILEGYMAATNTSQGGVDMSFLSPEILDYIQGMSGIGYNYDYSMSALEAQVRQNDQRLEYDYWNATQSAESAERAAGIYASASEAAAAMGADAAKYSADQSLAAAQEAAAASRYAADQALQGVRETNETKMKIAAAQLNLESKRIAAEEFGSPSNWRQQSAYLRSQGMTHADITPSAIQQAGEALGPVAPELAPQAIGAPPAAPAPLALPSPQQAIVGEQGPELATATAQGTQIQPLQPEQAWWLRKQGTPGMQGGGSLGLRSFDTAHYVGGRYVPGGVSRTKPPPHLMPWSPWYGQGESPAEGAAVPAPVGTGPTAPSGGGGVGYSPGLSLPTTGAGGGRVPTTMVPGGRGRKPGTTPTKMAAGGAGGGVVADTGGGVQPPGTTTGEPPYIGMLRQGSYVPLWEAWQGPRTFEGQEIPLKMPHEINYGDFVRLTPTEQQMSFNDWHVLGMAPDTALRIMQMSAMRGTGRSSIGYG